ALLWALQFWGISHSVLNRSLNVAHSDSGARVSDHLEIISEGDQWEGKNAQQNVSFSRGVVREFLRTSCNTIHRERNRTGRDPDRQSTGARERNRIRRFRGRNRAERQLRSGFAARKQSGDYPLAGFARNPLQRSLHTSARNGPVRFNKFIPRSGKGRGCRTGGSE